jgi:NAD(P)-dependent dehydrogenase (short-subunit alcohol dehydrogenase family)
MPPSGETFEGRVALVTGGGTGIGAAISAALADRGAKVMICHEDQALADRRAECLGEGDREIAAVGADLGSAAGCRYAVTRSLERFGRLDILVNNAGITGDPALSAFLDTSDEHLDLVIDVNLKGVFRCSREAARWMSGHGGGVIVNIASVNAYVASPHTAAYMAAKAGVVGLTKAMALELAPAGIRIVGIAPGNIDVGKVNGALAETPYPELPWWHHRYAPLGRRGTPDDIAAIAVFLCSDCASYVTGETILVDGGMLVH